VQLSVLDQSPIPEGLHAGDALRNTLDLARTADALGYHRFWLAEHHGTRGLACNSPEVMIGQVAMATQRIRVGSGGIMLPHYSPLKVAEEFSMLAALYPNRIDLGIGRAPGSSGLVAHALQRDRRQAPLDDFPEQMKELLGYFQTPQATPFPQMHGGLSVGEFHAPEFGLLGSSPQSAVWAAEWGLPYIFADFISPGGQPCAHVYRDEFQPSEWLTKPRVSVALWAVCAETDAEAMRLTASWRMMMLSLYRGQTIAVPTIEKAMEFLAKEGAPMDQLPAGRRVIAGSPATVRSAIEAAAAGYGADEVFLVNIVHDHTARRRSYELIAEAFDLTAS
jgi:luciferase family oxidoreductase group 1